MASSADRRSESSIKSPKSSSSRISFSEEVLMGASSPKSGQRSCLCSPTTHEGSFRCRLHRSSSGYVDKKPTPTPTPAPLPPAMANGVKHRPQQSVEAM